MARRLVKWIKRAVLFLVAFGVVGVLSVYLYVENSIDKYMSDEAQKEMLHVIESTPNYPVKFYQTYQKYFPKESSNTLWPWIFNSYFLDRREDCPCNVVAYDYQWALNKSKNRIDGFISGLVLRAFLENELGSEKCFKYKLKYAPLVYERGIDSLLKHAKKEPSQLTEREILQILVIQNRPTYYNPIRNPENLERRVSQLMEKFDSSEREWKYLKHNLYINTKGDIGFASEPNIVFVPPSELEGERSMCPNVFLTTFGYYDSITLKSTIDVETFEYVGASYYKDKNHIYSHYTVCDGGAFKIFSDDTASFKVWGLHATYKSKAYHYRWGQLDADIETFTTFSASDNIARDKNGFFSFGERISAAELEKEMGQELFNDLLDSAVPSF